MKLLGLVLSSLKKALTLVEVLVAIMLISIIIVAILQMRNNNLFLLDKTKLTLNHTNYIIMGANNIIKEEGEYFLDDLVNFNDDEIRRELKKVKIRNKILNEELIELPENNFIQNIKVIETQYILDNSNYQKSFFRFNLEY